MIITDESSLRLDCLPVTSLEEANDLRIKLESALKWSSEQGRPGVGLACPQIGIAKDMAIVRINKDIKLDLINARIVKKYYEFKFEGEGCLSFPNEFKTTLRYKEIFVNNNMILPYSFIATNFLSVVIQHEIDHLNKILLSDIGI